MSLGNIFRTIAPIAAGAMFGPGGSALAGSATAGTMGTSIAAGALTGAGIAALSGDDPFMGAVSGGLGGASGSGIGKAMSGTAAVAPTTANIPSGMYDAASPTLANAAGQLPAQNSALMAPSTGTNFGAGTMRNVTMPNTTQTVGSFGKPSDSTFLSRLGGGSKLMGAGKLGAAGLPVIGAAAMPNYNEADNPMAKYDPNRRLNLNMPTGIKNALMRDSGVRLLAEGGFLGRDPLYNLPTEVTPLTEEELDYLQTEQELEAEHQEFLKEQRKKSRKMYDELTDREKDKLQQLTQQKFARRIKRLGGHENYDAGLIASPTLPPAILTPPGLVASPMLPPAISTPDFEERARGYRSVETTGLPRYDDKYEAMAQGGYLETGMGDGVSDEIPASLDGEQDVMLSENEFVIPADVVSGLGNGSSDAGAEQLYAMMDRVRKARTGTEKMGKEVNAERLMPA